MLFLLNKYEHYNCSSYNYFKEIWALNLVDVIRRNNDKKYIKQILRTSVKK